MGKIKIGVSSCLLGEPVRYDGEHKRDPVVIDLLDERFEAISICPEVELGMGVPREPVYLQAGNPRLVGVESAREWDIADYNVKKLATLTNLSGFIIKSRSPSCGPVAVLHEKSGEKSTTAGLFAGAILKQFPTLPIIDEEALQDEKLRKNFIDRVLGYKGGSI
ncbi:MAG: DUF523 domain-containing protein [Nitrospinaceae bacterium]|nr:DUF523 domain-containing protein [Nitrospina sp.]MBT5868992.1 DUF523 domain-containing protein [Nitrospinaceae bacterium]MBT6346986.1 DUF523 domain-containing protein [Nitrospina sp.]